MSQRPFISITDFISPEQVRAAYQAYTECGDDPFYKSRLAIGVMMSEKTLNDKPSSWTDSFAKKENLPKIFCDKTIFSDIAVGNLFYVLHYFDSDSNNPLCQNLLKAKAHCGPHLDAIQLDMVEPPVHEMLAFTRVHPQIRFILQVNKIILEKINYSPKETLRYVATYRSLISHVLLDCSMGTGKSLDGKTLLPLMNAIFEQFPDIGLVIAGGLGPTTLHLLDEIVVQFPWVSIDAQSKLRPSGNAKIEPLNQEMVNNYIKNAIKYFDWHRRNIQ